LRETDVFISSWIDLTFKADVVEIKLALDKLQEMEQTHWRCSLPFVKRVL
jgi:hypothetical protein